jgi:hypothetical protein
MELCRHIRHSAGTLKHVVLHQQCKPTGCPAGTTGTEDIQIDWITIAVPGG